MDVEILGDLLDGFDALGSSTTLGRWSIIT
jgi:hypothetical protein